MAVVPEGAQRSEDGFHWWDGSAWQEVPEDERTPAAGAGHGDKQGDGQGQVTEEHLAQITSADQLDERTSPYFQPDHNMYPDDASMAEAHDLLSDEPSHDASGGVA
jgi:hypothetical protein